MAILQLLDADGAVIPAESFDVGITHADGIASDGKYTYAVVGNAVKVHDENNVAVPAYDFALDSS